MRTTINVSESLLKETETLYQTTNRSKAVEQALRDAVRLKKLEALMDLKGNIAFDEEAVRNLRSLEIHE
jgi:Arc/MetJ family transcription regulator